MVDVNTVKPDPRLMENIKECHGIRSAGASGDNSIATEQIVSAGKFQNSVT
jgi:hypothetical protein